MSQINTGLARRIIPCLDVRDGRVVKGVRFREHRVVGDIVDLSMRYRDEGADELVLYDITASPEARMVDTSWIEKIARVIDIPFCVAGGIRSAEAARRVLNCGADKVSVNSPAIQNPDLIGDLASQFGSQCVVIGIDSLETADGWFVKKFTGDPGKTRDAGLSTLDWVREVQERGAGEIVLNCMNQDGVRQGYDVKQLMEARKICRVPLIASGGAGTAQHFENVFREAAVDGALAASVFHNQVIAIPELKQFLQQNSVAVRL